MFIIKPIPALIDDAFDTNPNMANTIHGVRRITQGSRGKRTALFPSFKNNATIPVESMLELAHALVLERTPSVKCYRGNALSIHLSDGIVFPDFVIKNYDGTFEINEVKPSQENLTELQMKKYLELRNRLQRHSIDFKIIEAKNLPSVITFNALLHHYTIGHRTRWSVDQIVRATVLVSGISENDLEKMYDKLVENHLPPEIAHYVLFHDTDRIPHVSVSKKVVEVA